ncbi:unnamed protein product [Pieris macdunnoughi]|uniref:SAM domain-containing protein n=1 Tax=Pieris macdunnoughi TaxID=345717 RepID=A0A821VSN5_9NEOP|nr:unnamed protein product [Pieris macdunnoughi]
MAEETTHHKKPKKIKIPRRVPSVVIPPRVPIYVTPDKTTCTECGCFPKQEPYAKKKRLLPCLKSPPRLYELTAAVVDKIPLPSAFGWSVDVVGEWIEFMGYPEYKECFMKNQIDGKRLLMFEDPSRLPEINIRRFDHIQIITKAIRKLFSADFIRFIRSIGLPLRKPLTHCTWFKSRTGPSWGIRVNWSRCDMLRWMKIIMPEPVYMDHWDLVWYQKPDFPKVLIARIKMDRPKVHIPIYKPQVEYCLEYVVPRKFRFDTTIPEDEQFIWMERRELPKKKEKKEKKKKKEKKLTIPKETRLYPAKINLTGLNGKDLILARRKMSKPKFFG